MESVAGLSLAHTAALGVEEGEELDWDLYEYVDKSFVEMIAITNLRSRLFRG